jgi:hypothetical protein
LCRCEFFHNADTIDNDGCSDSFEHGGSVEPADIPVLHLYDTPSRSDRHGDVCNGVWDNNDTLVDIDVFADRNESSPRCWQSVAEQIFVPREALASKNAS